MIGPGTGLAPFRGFIQDRFHQRHKDGIAPPRTCSSVLFALKGKEVGATVLYFGCRRRDEDFIYEEELTAWQKDGTISELHLAFSREQASGAKEYVQHLLRKNAEAAWKLVQQQGAHIYVCG